MRYSVPRWEEIQLRKRPLTTKRKIYFFQHSIEMKNCFNRFCLYFRGDPSIVYLDGVTPPTSRQNRVFPNDVTLLTNVGSTNSVGLTNGGSPSSDVDESNESTGDATVTNGSSNGVTLTNGGSPGDVTHLNGRASNIGKVISSHHQRLLQTIREDDGESR